ncbi:MAG: PASTA domain-containing protein [Sedimentisphaerales bacterium]|nr:PASTA domain-containing protein [Sedimentisphaerales bacterium]MBN2841833.1 PASTA domain-containing protein [Sedimentisphaerales bacterium]
MRQLLFVLILVLVVSTGLFGQLSGSGTTGNPYVIASVSDFDVFCQNNVPGVDYWAQGVEISLTCDLDLTGREYYYGAIVNAETVEQLLTEGFQGAYYHGIFRGNDHTLSGYKFNTSGDYEYYSGLFSCLSGSAVVSDLHISNISSNFNKGRYLGLVAAVNGGTISGCTVSISYNTDSKMQYVGAIAGVNRGQIKDCIVDGLMYLPDSIYIGGICGKNESTVSSCVSSVSVVARQYGGTICGTNFLGTILNCYSTGTASGVVEIGGIAGQNFAGTISKCYFAGVVTGSDSGAIATTNYGDVLSCYYLAGSAVNAGGGTVLTGSQMRDQASYIGWDFAGINGQLPIWSMPADGYPYLTFEYEMTDMPDLVGLSLSQAQAELAAAGLVLGNVVYHTSFTYAADTVISQDPQAFGSVPVGSAIDLVVSGGVPYSGGLGTEQSPFLISTADDVMDMAQRCSDPANTVDISGYFRQTENISLAGHSFTRALVSGGASDTCIFFGVYDGEGHTISDITIVCPAAINEPVGLFGRLDSQAVVQNMILSNCSIAASGNVSYIGLLAGESEGLISNCQVQGVLNLSGTAGGLVGLSDGKIRDSFACVSASVSGNGANLGGLAGVISGQVERCFVRCNITASGIASYVGGLGGQVTADGSVERSVVSSEITVGNQSHKTGGFIGGNSGLIADCRVSGRSSYGTNSYDIGGFCGFSDGQLVRCFADTVISVVSGGATKGDFAGNALTLENCYYYTDKPIGQNAPAIRINGMALFTKESFTGFDFDLVWQIQPITGPTLGVKKQADLNADGIVNMGDLAILAGKWLE